MTEMFFLACGHSSSQINYILSLCDNDTFFIRLIPVLGNELNTSTHNPVESMYWFLNVIPE